MYDFRLEIIFKSVIIYIIMKYIIGGIGIVIVVAAIIAIIIALIGRDDAPDIDEERLQLTEHIDSTSEVSITTFGRIVADEDYRAIRITVSESERTLEIMHGYNLSVEERVELSNNSAAYEAFMQSLEHAAFTAVQADQPELEDGRCPLRTRSVYEVELDDDLVHRTWSSPCTGERGTFGGDGSTAVNLFRRQIPDYQDFRREVQL